MTAPPQTSLLGPLRTTGVTLDIGPFRVRVRSSIPDIAQHLADMYGCGTPLQAAFADFDISLTPSTGLHAWFHRQVNFHFDDDTPFKPLPLAQARALFEWGLNWCIASTAHQYLILHAAVLAKDDRCVIIPGRPGAGKSTLCAALAAAGWRLFSDEMALIDPADGRLWPLPRPISLKNQSIDIIQARFPEMRFGAVVRDTHKGTICHMRPPAESLEQALRPGQPRWVVYPRYAANASLEPVPVSPCQSLLRLMDDSFNLQVLGTTGFAVASRLTSTCEAHELRYGNLDQAMAWFDALAHQDAQSA